MKERVTKTEIKLEDYAHFLEDPYNKALSYEQLNQADLYEALSTIDLMKPQRSTLKDDFPPYDDGYALTLELVKQDLETLLWQECPVQSIQVVPAPTVKDNPAIYNGSDGVSRGSAISSFTITRKKRRSGRRKRMSAVYRRDVEQHNDTVGVMNGVKSGVARDHDDGLIQPETSSL